MIVYVTFSITRTKAKTTNSKRPGTKIRSFPEYTQRTKWIHLHTQRRIQIVSEQLDNYNLNCSGDDMNNLTKVPKMDGVSS
jgi:hypothetical protein